MSMATIWDIQSSAPTRDSGRTITRPVVPAVADSVPKDLFIPKCDGDKISEIGMSGIAVEKTPLDTLFFAHGQADETQAK